MTSIAFGWAGLTDYAARCIRVVIDASSEPVDVVATRPSGPIKGMERSLGQEVKWIEDGRRRIGWNQLGLACPEIFFQCGYFMPALCSLGSDVRARGGKVVLMTDTNWTGSLRQRLVDPLRHRLLLCWRFDAVMTPGKSGSHYSARMGYKRIASGMLGGDPTLFNGGAPLRERPKTFLFVGQLIERKNVLGLARAFIRFAADHDDWTLRICGSGPLHDQIPRHARIHVEGFAQPARLAEILREARCLVLPSLDEHWGLVVHEAALSGCALALSRAVGAADDLACEENAVLFAPRDHVEIESALREIASWDDERLAMAERASRTLAKQFGPQRFAAEAGKLADILQGRAT